MHEVKIDNKVANEELFNYEGPFDNEAPNDDEENENDDASNDEESDDEISDEDYEIQDMELLDDEVSEEDEGEYHIDEDIDEVLNQENSDKIADKALSSEQMPLISGEFAPYFKNVTEALMFCWVQKHNICKFKF